MALYPLCHSMIRRAYKANKNVFCTGVFSIPYIASLIRDADRRGRRLGQNELYHIVVDMGGPSWKSMFKNKNSSTAVQFLLRYTLSLLRMLSLKSEKGVTYKLHLHGKKKSKR